MGFSLLKVMWVWLTQFDHAFDDSWAAMKAGIDYLHAHPGGTDLYPDIFFRHHIKFQYPPTSLVPFWFAEQLGLELTPQLLNMLGRLVVIANAIANAWLMWLLLGRSAAFTGKRRLRTAATALVGAATLAFYPLMMAFYLGQVRLGSTRSSHSPASPGSMEANLFRAA